MSLVATPATRFRPRQRAALFVLLAAGLMFSVDSSILNVA